MRQNNKMFRGSSRNFVNKKEIIRSSTSSAYFLSFFYTGLICTLCGASSFRGTITQRRSPSGALVFLLECTNICKMYITMKCIIFSSSSGDLAFLGLNINKNDETKNNCHWYQKTNYSGGII